MLPNHDLHHDLVSVVAQRLHLTLHVVRDGLGPLGDLVGVVHLPAQLLVQTAVDDLLTTKRVLSLELSGAVQQFSLHYNSYLHCSGLELFGKRRSDLEILLLLFGFMFGHVRL